MRLDLTSEFPLLAINALVGFVWGPLAGWESSIRRRLSSGWNAWHVVKCRLSSSLSGPERVQARGHHDVLTIIHPELLVLNGVLQGVARGTQAVLAQTWDPLPLFIFVQLTKMLVRRWPLGWPLHADGSIISDVERHHAGQNAAPIVLLWTSCRILSVTEWL
jgi:hypothetical protein